MLVDLNLVLLVLITSVDFFIGVGIPFLELLFVCLEIGLVGRNSGDASGIFLGLAVDAY